MIKKIIGFLAIGILGIFFLLSFSLLLLSGFSEPPNQQGEDNQGFSFTDGDDRMTIEASRDVTFKIWYDNFETYLGQFNGRDVVGVDNRRSITVYETSDQYYSAESGRYRGSINLPLENVPVSESRNLQYNLDPVAQNISTRMFNDNRLDETPNKTLDYSLTLVGDEREPEIEITPERGSFDLSHIAVKTLGNVSISFPDLDVKSEKNFTENLSVSNQSVQYDRIVDIEKQKIRNDPSENQEMDSFRIRLKVASQSDNLRGFRNQSVENSDAIFLTFLDEDGYGTIDSAGFGWKHPVTGENLGYQENLERPYGRNEGIAVEVE